MKKGTELALSMVSTLFPAVMDPPGTGKVRTAWFVMVVVGFGSDWMIFPFKVEVELSSTARLRVAVMPVAPAGIVK